MNALVWGVAVVAAVCLLQVPATHLLSRYLEQDRADGDGDALPVSADAYDREPGVCPRCGHRNDPGFTYCAGCFGPLRTPGEG